jgi:hypothetical protein
VETNGKSKGKVNMRFKLWFELASLENLPDVELNKGPGKGSYECQFSIIKAIVFTIDINQTSEPWGGTEIEDIYSVVFRTICEITKNIHVRSQ